MKWCGKCETHKDESEFHISREKPDGLQRYCKTCLLASKSTNKPSVQRYATLKYMYGLSKEEVDALSEVCEICGGTKRLGIDHDHNFGFVRGVLCAQCNFGIGHFKNNIELLEKAIRYLKEK